MPPTKKPLVVSRLRNRLKQLGLKSFAEYYNHLLKAKETELEIFVNALTTNETYFFRHEVQFDYLKNTIFPSYVEKAKKGGKRTIKILSAACSTGEEIYSLALLVNEFFKDKPGWMVRLYAFDINSDVIKTAKEGIYGERSVKGIPQKMVDEHFTMTEEGKAGFKRKMFQLNQKIISKVEFKQHNLLEPFKIKDFDIIFLRNVMIYFDVPTKCKIVEQILGSLNPEGSFFISLSENMNEFRDRLSVICPGGFQKK